MKIEKINKYNDDMKEIIKRPSKGECLICAMKLKGQVEIETIYYYALNKKVDVCKKHVNL